MPQLKAIHAVSCPGFRVRILSLTASIRYLYSILTLPASPVSCPNSKDNCATNTYFGVLGCCDPSASSPCTIATTCIPSADIASLCTDSGCSSNAAIAKCTASSAQECYRWLFDYGTTVMTQHGCTAKGFTSTALRNAGPVTVTVTFSPSASASASPTPTDLFTTQPSTSGGKKPSIGPIVGGTVGGCIILSLVALAAFLIHRRRVKKSLSSTPSPNLPPPVSPFPHNSPEFSPVGFASPTSPGGWTENEIKSWQQAGSVYRPGVPMLGISEVHGEDRAVEMEVNEKGKRGWVVPGVGPVEVEAPVLGRDEKKRWWRGPVEAPS